MSYIRTSAHRAAQAERIRTWRPWEKSTGPKTADGKARAAKRGFKGGRRTAERALARALREHRALLCALIGGD